MASLTRSITLLVAFLTLLAASLLVLPACSDDASWPDKRGYQRLLNDFATVMNDAADELGSVNSLAEAEAIAPDLANWRAELEALLEHAGELDPAPTDRADELRELAQPAIDAQQRLVEQVQRLRSACVETPVALDVDLVFLGAATTRLFQELERPGARQAFSDWADDARRNAGYDPEADDPGPGADRFPDRRRPDRESFDDRRARMVSTHGASSVLTITLEGVPDGVELRELVELAKDRLGAQRHTANLSRGRARIVLAPVSITPDDAVSRIALGDATDIDAQQRWITIQIDRESLPASADDADADADGQ